MGTYLFNLHVRTDDRAAVRASLSQEAGGLPAYVSTPLQGWVSVYPAEKCNAVRLAWKLSGRLDTLTVGFEVYDSDDLRCAIYRGGKRVARRLTGPNEQAPEHGDAKRFAKYAKRTDVDEMQAILDERSPFAEDTAFKIAGAYGVTQERVEFSHQWGAHDAKSIPAGVTHVESSGRSAHRSRKHLAPPGEKRASVTAAAHADQPIEPTRIQFQGDEVTCTLGAGAKLTFRREDIRELRINPFTKLPFLFLRDGSAVFISARHADAFFEWSTPTKKKQVLHPVSVSFDGEEVCCALESGEKRALDRGNFNAIAMEPGVAPPALVLRGRDVDVILPEGTNRDAVSRWWHGKPPR